MTSSLVGSEMCIRDSISPVQGYRGGQSVTSPTVPQAIATKMSSWTPRLKSCLLYTSDAADDM
eukprot:5058171-Prorocentrum_lima.AAC.1